MFLVMGHSYSYTDLDSIISSVVFAEVWSAWGHPAKAVLLNPEGFKDTTLKILAHMGDIEPPEIVGRAELEDAELILVDHNDPVESYGKMGLSKIPYMVIDHHLDAGLPAGKKIIEQVGSTCTLIAEICRKEGFRLTERQARALAFGIASDTRGLKGRKTGERDIAVIDYLYREYTIPESVEEIAGLVLTTVDVQKMSMQDILGNSLKEYLGGRIGMAGIEVADETYRERLTEIMEHARQTEYGLYIFILLKHHVQESEVFYFDREFGIFPEKECRKGLISRGKDLVPEVMAKLNGGVKSLSTAGHVRPNFPQS